MPSKNKTPLGFNQWAGTDIPERLDFNGDNLLMDRLLQGKADMAKGVTPGNFAALTAAGGIADSGKSPEYYEAQLKSKVSESINPGDDIGDLLNYDSTVFAGLPNMRGLPTEGWYIGFSASNRARSRAIIAFDAGGGQTPPYYKAYVNDISTTWKQLAAATPPQEFDLPLVPGIQPAFADIPCVYSKDQFLRVFVAATVSGTFASNTASRISLLPAGYKPKASMRVPAICLGQDNVFKPAFAFVEASGAVNVFPTDTANQISFQISFLAVGTETI